jgi:sucrose phosphorylase
MQQFIENLAENGARLIRLDAVGYAVKRPYTNSFLIPETHEMIEWVKSVAEPRGVELLAEIHHNYRMQIHLANTRNVDWIYDFSLPLLVLQALHDVDAQYLKNWISIRPDCQITTLDTHDGIGVIDCAELMPEDVIERTVDMVKHSDGANSFRASGIGSDNVDIYQVNTTYYSALKHDDDAYMAARTIQFFVPGIPQVYYVGLFAGSNDTELLNRTNHGRDINRHYYTLAEIAREVERPVVKRLMELMRFRNTHPAFNGEFSMEETDNATLVLKWEKGESYAQAHIDLSTKKVTIEYRNEDSFEVLEMFP